MLYLTPNEVVLLRSMGVDGERKVHRAKGCCGTVGNAVNFISVVPYKLKGLWALVVPLANSMLRIEC